MKIFLYLITIFAILILLGCQSKFPLDKDLTKKNYTFFNQDSVEVIFHNIIKDKVTVIGFIYANCPDICPMTTHNMYLTQQKLKKNAIDNVLFVTVTFDPDRDSPSVLKKFGEIRDIDFNNWVFLRGDKKNTESLLRRFDITALKTDTTYFDDGELTYSVMHTDRIALIDNESRLKKNYRGSKVNLEELYNDIINLGE
jgi:protein SCO1/2